ncbi:hypothetical protein NIES4071_80060 [Calothrix sp. NIES-4071]|nr:hypothetical protein NIES4071_80060 [Calothrix sp. NIES-4071]BAZ62276.1 hypothetical protein NIES4105_79990 [Calothrix sp. NIES-4105]
MPLSNSVIRRYTPPTCTLEVSAQNSPLSQWMGKSVLKQLRFELRLDDPRLPENQRITIRGNRDQLEALCAAVTAYVQQFLHTQPDKFWESYNNSGDVTQILNGTEAPQDTHNSSTRLSTLGKPYNLNKTQFSSGDIHIEPSGYLSHNLYLGNLASPTSGEFVKLSLLQLFDLASALDEYSDDVLALPNLNTRRRTSVIPNWAPIAAVFALALGLTPFTIQYANRARQNQQSQQTAANTQIDTLQTPLPTVVATPGLLPTPLDTLPSIAGLPPTPPTGSVSTQLPIPTAIPTSGANINTNTLPNTTLPPGNIATTIPGSSATQRSNSGAASTLQPGTNFTFPSNLSPGNTLAIPEPTNPLPTTSRGKNPSPLTLPDSIALQPNITPTQTRSSSQTRTTASTRTNTSSKKLPSTTSPSAILPPTSNLPPLSALETPLNEPRPATPNRTQAGGTIDDSSLLNRLREARDSSGRVATASNRTTTTATNTIFDTPQVAEARTALRARWQPPQGLKQTLEYSLLLGVDGSIERILPIGKAARDYIDRTGMPLIGEQFVSPNRNGQSVRIRAVFSPDGKVQTFPEND